MPFLKVSKPSPGNVCPVRFRVEPANEPTPLLDSLQEYLLVDSRKAEAELYRKRAEGGREQWIVTPGETLTLTSVELDMAVEDFYEDTDL